MLLRIVTLGSILFASQAAFSEEIQLPSYTAIRDQYGVLPTPEAPHPLQDRASVSAGDIATTTAARDQEQLLLKEKCDELDRLQLEIRKLREATGTAQQILVKVQMLEVNLSNLRKLKVDTDWFAEGHLSDALVRQVLEATGQDAYEPTAGPEVQAESNDVSLFLDWLSRNNFAKVLSRPTLVMVNGNPASIHVGGEFPIAARKDPKAAVDFKTFGTELDVLASALGNNQVRLEFKASVSEVDYSHAVQIDGARIPGLRVRRCDTAVESSFGQTTILTGLVQQRTESRKSDGGGIEEVAVDVGLMIFVTPELVPPRDAPDACPGS